MAKSVQVIDAGGFLRTGSTSRGAPQAVPDGAR
jgi:hypothetical protein